MTGDTVSGPASAIRVAFYCDSSEIGGAEISFGYLVALLSPRIEATAVGTNERVVRAIAERRPGTRIELLPPVRRKSNVGAIAAHLRAIRRLRPEIFHVSLSSPWGSQWAVLAALFTLRVRVVVTERSPWPSKRLKHRVYKRLTSPLLAAHVSLGKTSARAVAKLSGVAPERIRVIRSGAPDIPLDPLPRATPGPIIGSLGRLEHEKGFDILVRALGDLPGVTAVIVGDGKERQDLERLAERLGVSERVVFTGWSDEARRYLTTFDLYVLPSCFEVLSLGIAEAMLAGLPVVAADVGGVCDGVLEGETGLLVPPEDPVALARAIRTLLDDPARIHEMGRKGRESALAAFTAQTMAEQYESLFEELARR